MKLSGGNYGGYEIVNDEAILTIEGEVVDTQPITVDGTDSIINGWVYNEEGIFVGMA